METSFVQRLHAQSSIAELPSYATSLDLEARGGELGQVFEHQPGLPGVVLREGNEVRGAISRGQYLRLVGRYLGQEVYHPRPIRLMLEALEASEEPLILEARTPVQEAVRQALRRPRELVYEPVIMEAGTVETNGNAVGDGNGRPGRKELRLLDFQDLLLADSRISALRNDQMRQILGTVQEGFLLLDREHLIASEYSRSIESIFRTEHIAGRRFEELLAESLGFDLADLGKGYVDTLFNPNVIERLVADINPLARVEASFLPSRVDGDVGARPLRRHLTFRFLRGFDGRKIERVLVRVEDVTRQTELEQELAAQEARAREKVDLVYDLVRCGFEPIDSFLSELDPLLAATVDLLGRGEGAGEPGLERKAETLLRRAHGLKGEAGLLGLELYQDRLHRLEDRLVEIRRGGGELRHLVSLAPAVRDLRALVDDTRETLDQIGRLRPNRETGAADLAESGRPAVAEASPATTPAGSSATVPDVEEDLFVEVARLVEELSRRLGKPARFVSRNPESEIPAAYRPLIRRILVQLVRNSLVHGLEEIRCRSERGKPTLGTLQLAVRDDPRRGQVELIFQDDGAGLDLDSLRRRGTELGRGNLGEAELTELIFTSGLSTAAETTLDAGRGVGLDLVRAEVESAGGAIRCHSRPHTFCAFQIVLPRDPKL